MGIFRLEVGLGGDLVHGGGAGWGSCVWRLGWVETSRNEGGAGRDFVMEV